MPNVVEVIFRGVDRLSRTVRSSIRGFKELGSTVVNVDRHLARLAFVATAAFGIAVKQAIEFEKTMSEIVGLVGLSSKEVEGFSEEIIKVALATGRGRNELGKALFFITSAGARGAEAMEILEASARAATAGLGSTVTIADAVTSAVNAYGSEVLSADEATNILVATVREGKAAADSIAGSLGKVVSIAAESGVSFDQVGATLAALTRVGLSADEASTALRSTLTGILKPATDAEKALRELGTSSSEFRRIVRERGLIAALQELKETIGNNETAMTRVFPNVRAVAGVLALVGGNADEAAKIFASMEDTTGSLDKAFEAAAETTGVKLKRAFQELDVVIEEIADNTLPAYVAVLREVAEITNSVASFSRKLGEDLGFMIGEFIHGADAIVPFEEELKKTQEEIARLTNRSGTVSLIDPDPEELQALRDRETQLLRLIEIQRRMELEDFNLRLDLENEAELAEQVEDFIGRVLEEVDVPTPTVRVPINFDLTAEDIREPDIQTTDFLDVIFPGIEAAPDKFTAIVNDIQGVTSQMVDGVVQHVSEAQTELKKFSIGRVGGEGAEVVIISEEDLEDTAEKVDAFAKFIEETNIQAARSIQQAFSDFFFDPFQDGLDGMVKGFLGAIRRMLANQLAARLFRFLGGIGGGGEGSFGGVFSSLFSIPFGTGKGTGGPTLPGRITPINEREPEFLLTGSRGQIVPLSKAASVGVGGGQVNFQPQTEINVLSPVSMADVEGMVRRNNDLMLARVKDLIDDRGFE